MLQAEGERLVRQHFPDATIFKPAHMVGVEDRLFNTYAQLAKRLPLIPLIDGGRRRLQPVWVRDVADAMVSTLTSSASQGQTYHLAGPDILSYAFNPDPFLSCSSCAWPAAAALPASPSGMPTTAKPSEAGLSLGCLQGTWPFAIVADLRSAQRAALCRSHAGHANMK